jgi:very-short-patch-repair endonuclease
VGPLPQRPSVSVASAPSPTERPGTVAKPPQLHISPLLFVWPVLGVFIPFILFLLVIAGLAYGLRRFVPRGRSWDDLPYQKAERLLTPAERTFYEALCTAIDERWRIFAKVRLGDLLEVPYGTMNRRLYRNRIDQKHVDFVLCSATSFAPVLAIELDDRSHERWEARQRDAVKDAALQAAGLPVLRVHVTETHTPAELRERIDGLLRHLAVDDEWAALKL